VSGPCQKCPCPDACDRSPAYCLWAAEDPPDPVKLRHICEASARRRDPAAFPPLTIQAVNLGRAFWDWAVSGFSMATEAEQARRLEVCRACEWFVPESVRCRHMGCGCYLTVKVKLLTSHCPLSSPKW
jgi:hypothetical protein